MSGRQSQANLELGDLSQAPKLLEREDFQRTDLEYQKWNNAVLANRDAESQSFRFAHTSLDRRSQRPIDQQLDIVAIQEQH